MSMLLIPYLIAISILTITPGLDTTLIIRTATLEGKTKAFQAALGINLGCIVWGVIVACGLGALLMTSDLAFNALKMDRGNLPNMVRTQSPVKTS